MASREMELDQVGTFPTGTIYYYTVYPNGHQVGGDKCFVTIPIYNPERTNATIVDAYVYDANGGLTNITSAVTVAGVQINYIIIHIVFSATHVGKMLRISFVDS